VRLQAHIKTFLALFVAGSYATAAQPGNVLIYQGKLIVGTTDFDGTGFFKFALINNTGTKTYWSNDGKSVGGSEPSKALPLQVARGKYVVALGDAQANMVSLAASDLPKSDLRLRVWFSSDKVHFYKLTPDQPIAFQKDKLIVGGAQRGTGTAVSTVGQKGEGSAGRAKAKTKESTANKESYGSSKIGRWITRGLGGWSLGKRVTSTGSSTASAARSTGGAHTSEEMAPPTAAGTEETIEEGEPEAPSASPEEAAEDLAREAHTASDKLVTGESKGKGAEPPEGPGEATKKSGAAPESSKNQSSDPIVSHNPHIDVPSEPVEPKETVHVTVYADASPRKKREDQYGSIVTPDEPNVEEFKMSVYLLVSNQFKLMGTEDHKPITVYRSKAESTRTSFNIKVEPNAQGTGYVTALFYYQGYPCGRVRRAITVGYRDNPQDVKKSREASTEEINPPPVVAATAEGTTPSLAGPDLTITVIKTDDNPLRYQYFVIGPNVSDENRQVDNWGNYTDPKTLLQQFYGQFGDRAQPEQARKSLLDAGWTAYDGIPRLVDESLRQLIDEEHFPKTILIFSDEPHYPWELIIPHWSDKEMNDPLPLGVSSAIGRWTSNPRAAFRFPARQIKLDKSVFFAPAYSTNALESSANEQKIIEDAMHGTAIPATFDSLCDNLQSDITLLHFICHGASDGDSPGQQAIFAADETVAGDSTVEDPDEEGESLPPRRSSNRITMGELAQCSAMKKFCSNRPLIFINACEVGQSIKTWSAVGGFGPTFLQLNAECVRYTCR
jgi:hypothetical protein